MDYPEWEIWPSVFFNGHCCVVHATNQPNHVHHVSQKRVDEEGHCFPHRFPVVVLDVRVAEERHLAQEGCHGQHPGEAKRCQQQMGPVIYDYLVHEPHYGHLAAPLGDLDPAPRPGQPVHALCERHPQEAQGHENED